LFLGPNILHTNQFSYTLIIVCDLNLCQRIRGVAIVSLAVFAWLLHVDAHALGYYALGVGI
jgi:hypothetical protein